MKFEFHLQEINLKPEERLISKRGLQRNGRVQQFVDSETMRKSSPYVPFDTGMLHDSTIRHTKVGSGEVVWRTPYARRMYYNPQYNFQGAPQRGAKWFERMKAQHKDEILRGAARMAGARGGKK